MSCSLCRANELRRAELEQNLEYNYKYGCWDFWYSTRERQRYFDVNTQHELKVCVEVCVWPGHHCAAKNGVLFCAQKWRVLSQLQIKKRRRAITYKYLPLGGVKMYTLFSTNNMILGMVFDLCFLRWSQSRAHTHTEKFCEVKYKLSVRIATGFEVRFKQWLHVLQCKVRRPRCICNMQLPPVAKQ